MALSPVEEETFCLKGILTKQGHFRKSWKTRFFEIQRWQGGIKIYYYENQNKLKRKGVIDMSSTQNFSVEQFHSTFEGHDNVFVLKYQEKDKPKDFFLAAPSEIERQRWIESLLYWGKGIVPKHDEDSNEISIARAKERAKLRLKGKRVHREGWMMKRGQHNPKPQKRYFILGSSRLTDSIVYFEDEQQTKRRGEIPLKNARIEQREKDIRIHSTQSCEDLNARSFYLQCDNLHSAQLWVNAISLGSKALEEEQKWEDLYLN